MISTIFENAQRVITQTLDWAQTAWQTSTANRISDYSQAGICNGELSEFVITAGSNNTPTTPSVTIGDGAAYDINGNRIFIAATDSIPFNSALPSTTTNDGTGNFVATPFSTGCVNVPLTINSFNYIWIDYLETIDPAIFTLNDITLAKQFYQQSDGYRITVTTTNVAPYATSVYLGSVNLTGFGVVSTSTISQVGRVYSANLPYRTLIETPALDKSDVTTSYSLGNTYFADAHTKAIGTGTVGPHNPHGLSPVDIGISGASTIQFHQEFLHSPGLVGASTNVQAQIVNVTPGFDYLLVNAISPGGVVTSNGISLTNTDIPLTTTLQFTNTDASGTWYIYVDVVNKLIGRTQTNLISTPNPNQYLIYTVIYTYPDPDTSNGHLTALSDQRVFGNIGTRELQAGSITGIKINSSALSPIGALSQDGSGNLRVNYDNVTVTISGDALSVIPGGLAGSGLTASGHVLNVNPDNSTVAILSNQVAVANNGITPTQLNPSVAGNGLSGGAGSPLSVNVDNSTIQISSDILNVKPGGIGSTQIAAGAVGATQTSDGAASVRSSYGLSYNGAVTTGVAWENKASNSFTIPSSTQSILVQWAVSITSSGVAGQGIGIGIDNIPLMTLLTTSVSDGFPDTFPGVGNPAHTPIIYNPSLQLAAGSHSIQLWLHGTSGGGGGSMNTSVTVYLMYVDK